MHTTDRFKYLLEQYLSGKITLAEQNEFYELLATQEYDNILDLSIENHLVNGVEGVNSDLPPHIAEEIVRNIHNAEKSTAKILPLKTKKHKPWRWIAAASVILIISTIFLFTRNQNNNSGMLAMVPPDAIIEKNVTTNPRLITLADGSVITLAPQSTIHFQGNFNDSTREVYLEGEAFFQVAKNPRKPFLVYYNNLVTKVLGTSFRVNTNAKTGNIEVAVMTGKVQVSENDKILKDQRTTASVILAPNQKAIYQVEKGLLETSLVEAPQPLQTNHETKQQPQKFIYDQERLETIFHELETAYGIEILVETANLNNCVFTGDVSNQDLFTMLRIICLTTNSTYEINGTRILVRGTGCN
jgi:hypothetical protein